MSKCLHTLAWISTTVQSAWPSMLLQLDPEIRNIIFIFYLLGLIVNHCTLKVVTLFFPVAALTFIVSSRMSFINFSTLCDQDLLLSVLKLAQLNFCSKTYFGKMCNISLYVNLIALLSRHVILYILVSCTWISRLC